MAVSEIGAPTAVQPTWDASNNTTVTVSAPSGTNRLMVVTVHGYQSSGWSMGVTSVTYGGQALTELRDADQISGVPKTHLGLFYLDEAGIAAASNTNLNVDYLVAGGQALTAGTVIHAFYEGVNQGNPIDGDSVTTVNGASLNSSPAPVDGLLLGMVTINPQVNVSWTAGPTTPELLEEVEDDNANGITCSWASCFNDTTSIVTRDVGYTASASTTKTTLARVSINPDAGQDVSIGQPSTTDTALAVDFMGNINVPIDIAETTDTALDLTEQTSTTVTIGLPETADTALDVTSNSTITLGQPSTTDTALAFAGVSLVIGQPSTTDTAIPAASGASATITIGQPGTTDTAFPLQALVAAQLTIGLATETDSALALTLDQEPVIELGLPAAVHQALPLTAATVAAGVLSYDQNGDLLDFATVNDHLEYLYDQLNAGIAQANYDDDGVIGREHIVRPKFWGAPRFGMTGRMLSRYGWLENARSRPTPDRFALGRREDRDSMAWWHLSGDSGVFATRFGTSVYVPVESRANVTCQFTLAVTQTGWVAPGPETPAQVMGRFLIRRRRRAAGQDWSIQRHSALEIYPDDTRTQAYCLASVRLAEPGDYDLQLVWDQDGHEAPDPSIVQLDLMTVSWAVDIYPIIPGAE